jgi:hypothetical protein
VKLGYFAFGLAHGIVVTDHAGVVINADYVGVDNPSTSNIGTPNVHVSAVSDALHRRSARFQECLIAQRQVLAIDEQDATNKGHMYP